MEKKRIISIIAMIIGLATLVTGVVFLVLKLNSGPAVADGEYLVSAGEWVLDNDPSCASAKKDEADDASKTDAGDEAETVDGTDSGPESSETKPEVACESRVVWKFTEIGKGTLTTNGHKNDYNFAWALEDGKMTIRTEWLYEMDDEYDYTLNQEDGILTLKSGEKEFRFASQQ